MIRFRCFITLPLLIFPFLTLSAQSSDAEAYVQHYGFLAEEEMARTGVPAAISLAQGLLESQAGTGWLVTHSHNHFGIKCKSGWLGQTINYDDDKRQECFRVYDSDSSSWRDHSDFLKQTPRYAFLFYLDPMDYKAWAYGLKQAGYATDKQYAQRLITTIEKYGLQQYSVQGLAMMKQSQEPSNDFAAMLDKKVAADRKAAGIPDRTPPPVVATTPQDSLAYPAGVFRINGKKVVYQSAGTQLITVAEQYDLRLRRLLVYNELPGDVLDKDMLVFLQKKGKEGAHDSHQVVAGESLHQIAQEEGIRLKWLCIRNGIEPGALLEPGETLYLHGYAPEEQAAARQKNQGFWYTLTHLFSKKPESAQAIIATRETLQAPPESVSTTKQPEAEYSAGNSVSQKPPEVTHYKVQQGDTLYGISRKYGVPVAQLRAWNHLEGDLIQVGETLIVERK
jgi:LysM repeat protein